MTQPALSTCTVCPQHDGDVIDPQYLPFTGSVLLQHFAEVPTTGPPCKYLHHYRRSATEAQAHRPQHAAGWPGNASCTAVQHQIEKDERFWVVTALLTAFYAPDRVAALSAILADAFGDVPPIDGDFESWPQALGAAADLRLYFEANLPAPVAYKTALAEKLGVHALIPHQRAVGAVKVQAFQAGKGIAPALEGATKVDALLVSVSTGAAVAFEAKVLSDTSTHTTYDAVRNQIARNIDVLLDRNHNVCAELRSRMPERTCFVLLTPQMFLDNPESRLYGHLLPGYQRNPGLLARHLPHRAPDVLTSFSRRLGWTTWERISQLIPDACPWLGES